MNSRLNLSLREKNGLVYTVESLYIPLSDTGYWEVYFIAETHIPDTPPNRGHIHCPANGYDCPYWKDGICGLWSKKEGYVDPYGECDDFAAFWDKDDDYIDYGED